MGCGALVSVSVEADLVPRVADLGHLLGERLDGVGGAEPRRFDAVLVPEPQQPVDAYGGAEDASGDVGRGLLGAVAGVDPEHVNLKSGNTMV